MVSQKFWCHNCCRQFTSMRNSEGGISSEVFCNICNSVCEQITENNNPRQFRVFDSNHTQNPNLNNQSQQQNPHPQGNHQHAHMHFLDFFLPVQEFIFIQRPQQNNNQHGPQQNNSQQGPQQNNTNPNEQNAQNGQNVHFVHFLGFPFSPFGDLEILRRMQTMRLFEEFLSRNQQEAGAPPAEKEVIKNLPEVIFGGDVLEKYKSNPCPVCQEEFKEKDVGKELKCKHIFHKDCIEPWLNMHRTCPCCRNEVL